MKDLIALHDFMVIPNIRLERKSLRFFEIFFFIFFSFLQRLAINFVCTIGIYDCSPTIWQGKDAALTEACGPLGKERAGVDF